MKSNVLFFDAIGLYKNWNYSSPESPDDQKYKRQIDEAAELV